MLGAHSHSEADAMQFNFVPISFCCGPLIHPFTFRGLRTYVQAVASMFVVLMLMILGSSETYSPLL